MNRRRQTLLLIVLLAVLAWTMWITFRGESGPVVSAGNQVPAPPATLPVDVAGGEARLHLEQLDRQAGTAEAGRTNLFQYRQGLPPAPSRSGGSNPTRPGAANPSLPSPPDTGDAKATPTTVTPPPPPAPPITLKYQGYGSTVGTRLTAFLSDDQRHFNVTEGEVLMGRYRIVRVTESAVEIEDLQFNRRQSLPLVKP